MINKIDLVIFLPILLILVVLILYPFIVTRVLCLEQAGQFGDLFGAVNALFTGLAFWGVLYTIRKDHQKSEKDKDDLAKKASIEENEHYTLILKAIKNETEIICNVLQNLLEQWENNVIEFKKCIEQKEKGAIKPDFPKLYLTKFHFNDTFLSSMKIEILKHKTNDTTVSNIFKFIFTANEFSQTYGTGTNMFVSKLEKNDFSYTEDLVSSLKTIELINRFSKYCKDFIVIINDEISVAEENTRAVYSKMGVVQKK